LRIGGPAALWVSVDVLSDDYNNLLQVIALCRSHDVPFFTMGSGSNILAPDAGYDGVIIALARGVAAPRITDNAVQVDAGSLLGDLVRTTAQLGWSDLEFLVGIPGTVGGALAMNAGTAKRWIGEVVKTVTVLDLSRTDQVELQYLSADEITWGYRSSSLRDAALILAAELFLKERQDPLTIQKDLQERLELRKKSQPLSLPNAGSVFRNPDGDSAGRLIEAVGLKGKTIGGAQFSELHANFIVNRGNASSEDVMALIKDAQQRVFEEYGVRLQKEIRLLGTET